MNGQKVTDIVADYCAKFRYEDIPADVLKITKQVFLDTVGLMLGGVDLDKGRLGIELARRIGGGVEECTLVGTNYKVSAAAAAYGNGELSHTLDGDILMNPAHMTTYMVSAILAAAEEKHVSGRELMTAMVLGIDIASRVGISQGGFRIECDDDSLTRIQKMALAPRYGMGCLSFGGAVGAAHIYGCDTDQMKDALGHCAFFLPEGSHQRFLCGPRAGMMKYSPAGWGNLVSISAAMLAQMGAFGDREIFDGEHGFWAMQGTLKKLDEWLYKDLGSYYAIRDVRYKYYPCDGIFQPACNLVEEIVAEHDIKPEDIEHIQIHCEFIAPAFLNKTIEYNTDCHASFPYSVSCAAHRIKPGPLWQTEKTRKDPSVLALMDRIGFEDYPACDEARHLDIDVEKLAFLNRRPQLVEITLKDGRKFSKSQMYMKFMSCGNPDYAITDEQLADKFRRNAEFTLAPEQIERAIDACLHVDEFEDTADFMALLVP